MSRGRSVVAGGAAATFRIEVPTDCQGCILAYRKEVNNMYINGTLPEACNTSTGIVTGGVLVM
jgi:hypothetical protein